MGVSPEANLINALQDYLIDVSRVIVSAMLQNIVQKRVMPYLPSCQSGSRSKSYLWVKSFLTEKEKFTKAIIKLFV